MLGIELEFWAKFEVSSLYFITSMNKAYLHVSIDQVEADQG